jgi:hypothetical protein
MLYLGPNYPRKVGQIAIHNFITPLSIPIKSYDEKTIFGDFKKFHGNRYNFPISENFAPKIWNLMYLKSIQITANFEPNPEYA